MCSNADTNPKRKEEHGKEECGNERRVSQRMTNVCVYANNAFEWTAGGSFGATNASKYLVG